ncbi:unnamed protein product (macronuclear) [Paramecium tetraurelia]|uniref:PAS domain-containing protein n=1 Tax=Paramecium tetraurelia TaxID=5888 RepID=A0CDD3_PARTE|nr:uncharacterized protein GSPATT00007011001 [Paramecium tetraurelia]CAK68800.1 unnamed protein product [Paramecium tetraurelia]|eukprot:XP_001436197.1 hypothetical protein (macronuclear) [Paramecium tetraurelia strain d4-2]
MQKREQINQIVNSLKYKFFKVIYLILKQWSNYQWITIIICLTQYLQYTYLNFGLKVQYVWRNKAYSDMINLLLKYFTITISVKNLGIGTYLTIFYFCLGLVLFSILLIMLLAFVIQNKKLQRGPLILLRLLLRIILTFGFWPIVRMQFGLLACEYNKKGKLIMMFEQSQECWTSDYYIHAIVAILGLIITLSFGVLMAFVTYESRRTDQDANAMRNGRSYYQLLIYIFTQIMTYQLLATPEYTILIIAVFLIGSSIVFINTHIDQPYYDTFIQKMWSILAGVNFWTIIMMFYSYLLDGKTFQNTIQAWLLGIPLIIGIIIFRQREQFDLMRANLRKFQDGGQVIKLCEYLLLLIHNSSKSQRYQLLIDSYIEVHKEVCNRNDCVVKLKEEMANKFKGNPKYTNRKNIVNELITQIYQESIKNFPEDIQLRLSYVYFLYDNKKSYSLIMSELVQAMEFKPTFDYEFHIYRYKLIIEEESQQKAEQFDISNSTKQTKQLIEVLEQAALQMIEFWISMSDDHPDMNKLMSLGFKILKQKEEIDLFWSKLKNSDSLKLFNLMAKFYLLVLDDQEVSDQLQNQLWVLQKIKQQEVTEIEEVCNKSIPTLVVTAQFQNFHIQTVNKALCSLLGYSKTDLIGRSVNQVIPEIYATQHNSCLELFIENQAKYQQNLVTQIVYLQAKSNYIIPLYSNVKLIQTNNNQLYFIAQYQQTFSPKQQCILLLDMEGYIENITSSCIILLRLDIIKIQMRRINIKELFPDFHFRKQEFLQKSGAKLHLIPHGLKFSTRTVDTIDFQCYLNYIQFPCIQDEQLYGIVMRLEKIISHNASESILKLTPQQQPKITRFPIFQFIPPSVYYLDYLSVTEIEESMDLKLSQDNQPKLSKIVNYFCMVKRMSQSQKQSIHYDDGIRVKRLWDGQIRDLEDFDIEQQQLEDDEEEYLNSQQLIKEKDKEMQEFQHYFELFQSKTSMYKLLINSNVSRGFQILNYLVNISLFVLYISGLLVFIFNLNDDLNVSNMIFNLSLNNKRLSTCLMIQTILQDVRLLNYGKINGDFDYIEQQFKKIQDLIQIHTSLMTSEPLINQEYLEYSDAYFSLNIELQSLDGSKKNYTYKEAIDLLIGKALYLNSGNISKFDDSDVDFYFYNYNTINSITKNYQIPLNYRYYSIKSVAQNSLDNKLIFLILQTLLQLIAYILIALYLIQFNRFQHQIYQLFFEKCESFLSFLNIGEDENDEVQDDKQMKYTSDQDENKMMNNKQIKNWKNSNKKFKNFMGVVFLIFAIIEGYFIYQYISAQGVVEATFNLSPILNTTSLLESQYRLGDNAIREYLVNPNQSIYCNPNPLKFINNYFDRLYETNADVQTKFTQNLDLFQPDYINLFQELFVKNPCPTVGILQDFITEDYCNTFFNGVVSEGLSIGLTKYFESLELFLLQYQSYQLQEGKDEIRNLVIYLLNTTLSVEIRTMEKVVIRYTQRYLIDQLEQSIKDSFSELSLTRILLFICFTWYILFITFFLWIPANQALIKQIQKSRTLILNMPMSTLMNSALVRRYIRQVLKN